MKKLIYICILSIVVMSCEKKETYEKLSNNQINKNAVLFKDDDFKDVSKLKSIELSTISDSLLFSGNLIATKNYLFINEIKTDKYIHIIKLPNEKYIGKYGNRGKGPGETIFDFPFSKSKKGDLLVLDQIQKKIVEINPDSLIKNNSFENEYKLKSSVQCEGVSIDNNKMFFLNVGDTTARLFETDIKGDNLKRYGKLPQLISSSRDIRFRNEIYLSYMNQHNDIFAIDYCYLPLIQIFNKKTNRWTVLIGPENSMPTDKNYNKRTFYSMIRITNKYIYALYNGKNFPGEDWQEGNNIYIFNHQGKIMKKLILDRGIINFEIFEDRIIYGLTDGDKGTRLLKFEISK